MDDSLRGKIDQVWELLRQQLRIERWEGNQLSRISQVHHRLLALLSVLNDFVARDVIQEWCVCITNSEVDAGEVDGFLLRIPLMTIPADDQIWIWPAPTKEQKTALFIAVEKNIRILRHKFGINDLELSNSLKKNTLSKNISILLESVTCIKNQIKTLCVLLKIVVRMSDEYQCEYVDMTNKLNQHFDWFESLNQQEIWHAIDSMANLLELQM